MVAPFFVFKPNENKMKTKNILTKTMLLSVMLLAALNNYAAYNGGTITIKVGESYHVDASLGGGLVQSGSWSRSNATFYISSRSKKTCTITGLRVGTGKLYYTGYAGAYTADQYWTVNVIGNGDGDGGNQSELTVSATPAGGNVAWGTEVTLTSNNYSALISYTLDGSDPLTSSTRKSIPSGEAVTINETCTLKAYASYITKSKVYSWNYTVDNSKIGLVMDVYSGMFGGINEDGTATPGSQAYLSTSVSDAEIYYTTDGSTPSRSSIPYEGVVYIEKDMTLKAIAYKNGYKESDVISRDFILGNFKTNCTFYANVGIDSDIDIEFKVINGANKTIQVGDGFHRAIGSDIGSIGVPSMVKDLNVIRIAKDAFHNSWLSHIYLPDGIEEIEDGAFEFAHIEDIVIPKTVTKIGEKNVFYNPIATEPTLNSIQVAEGNKVYDSRNNCNAIIETKTNKLMYGCKNTIVPDDIETIGYYAFRDTGLKTITIPKTLKAIEEYGLYCIFDTIYSNLENPFPITTNNAILPSARTILYVPQGTKSKYESTTGWKDFKNIVEVGSGDPSGITDVMTDDNKNTPIYNISGQRVNNLQGKKGVYIVGGKKVLVK